MKKISIELNGIEQLFQEIEFDPFDANGRCESGISDLYNQTQNLPRSAALQIELNLPLEAEREKTKEEIETAIKRYCEVQISKSEMEIREIRHQGLRDVGWASVISILLLVGAYLVTQLIFLPEVIIYLLATGAGIIAWVALWPPLDSILYAWSPYRQRKLRYQQLKLAQVVLNFQNKDSGK